MIDRQLMRHWDDAYRQGEDTRSWFQTAADPSLRILDGLDIGRGDGIIDVGGGASRLADGLVNRGFSDVTVLDVSRAAMDLARDRLGDRAHAITWLTTDLMAWRPDRTYRVWHDRAVLHFFVDPAARTAYLEAMRMATTVGSVAVIATFAPDGPEQCSGLPVARYDATTLGELLGSRWTALEDHAERHQTPTGGTQAFTWAVLRRIH